MRLTERQKEAVEYIKEKNRITDKEYKNITFVSRQSTSRELVDLTQKGISRQVVIKEMCIYALTPHPLNTLKDSEVGEMRKHQLCAGFNS